MPISMHSASAPTFVQTLSALSKIIDKAEAHCAAKKIEPAVLLDARLFPDMLAFTRQVQLACDFAKNTMARLAAQEPPKKADDEKTFDELKQRIAWTIDFVKAAKPEQMNGSEEREISFPVGKQSMSLKGEAYLIVFALPNFFFHATTAYDILRHNGIEVGKRDFLGWI
jgi:uncharacterized protein